MSIEQLNFHTNKTIQNPHNENTRSHFVAEITSALNIRFNNRNDSSPKLTTKLNREKFEASEALYDVFNKSNKKEATSIK